MIDSVSETVRMNWEEVLGMQLPVFLNILCYAIDKADNEARKLNNSIGKLKI